MKKLLVIIALFLSFNAIGQKEKVQCLGITKSGNQCKRMLDSTSYCWQHELKHDNSIKAVQRTLKAGILKQSTDTRGLTSVVYRDKEGKVWALDYISKQELEELINSLK